MPKNDVVLVTGGCGFIGSHFVRYQLERYPNVKVINIDNLSYAADPKRLSDVAKNPRYQFLKADIMDKRKIVHHLHSDTGVQSFTGTSADRFAGQQDERGTNSLAGRGEDITHSVRQAACVFAVDQRRQPAVNHPSKSAVPLLIRRRTHSAVYRTSEARCSSAIVRDPVRNITPLSCCAHESIRLRKPAFFPRYRASSRGRADAARSAPSARHFAAMMPVVIPPEAIKVNGWA